MLSMRVYGIGTPYGYAFTVDVSSKHWVGTALHLFAHNCLILRRVPAAQARVSDIFAVLHLLLCTPLSLTVRN